MKFLFLNDIQAIISKERKSNKSIGFVPTMGALHIGHLKIVERASIENDWVVVSIFVNPKQFNNQEDLKKYPRTLKDDLKLLSHLNNVFVFQPSEKEVFKSDIDFSPMDLGPLSTIMEGKFRPGHFEGVVHVVHNLFNLIHPNKAYFGMKDYQQLAIIKMLVNHYNFSIEIISCETFRDENGLALSSRNKRLSTLGKKNALIIYQTLEYIKNNKSHYSIEMLKTIAADFFKNGSLELEYLEFREISSLNEAKSFDLPVICFVAAYCEGVRLIDNMLV